MLPRSMELLKLKSEINFVGKSRLAFIFSGILIAVGLVSILVQGGLKYGIDFAGGTLVQLKFESAPRIDDVRAGLKEIGLGDATIQEFGSKNDILVRVERSEGKLEEVGTLIKNSLEKNQGTGKIIVERVEMVGPKVGKDLREKALLAIVYSLAGILVYISWRFELAYAFGAILALLHDVLITMGAFSILGKEFDLVVIAAFLTIIGYSLNDTIVIYDRIRENLRRRGKEALSVIINTSINQTLSRTLITSGTTLLVVVALFFLGGEIIHDFAFALMVGIFVGTYSSIFIASIFLILWEAQVRAKKA